MSKKKDKKEPETISGGTITLHQDAVTVAIMYFLFAQGMSPGRDITYNNVNSEGFTATVQIMKGDEE